MSGTQTQPGPVTRTLLRWLMRPTLVTAIEPLSRHFRLIDLHGDGLKDVAWTPGQKVQIAMGYGLTTRTYTPMSWDTDRGATRLLAFAHGDGPGSEWTTGLRVGDACQFFGPRRSLDLSALGRPATLFGDETSFGLAASLRDAPQGDGAAFVFEVSDADESRPVLAALGLGDAIVIERAADDAHLDEAQDRLVRRAAEGGDFILTGGAPSIQRVSRALKAAGVGSARLKVKAYWAPGKTGLD